LTYTFSPAIAGLKPSAIREIFKITQKPGIISFAAGNPSPDTFPAAELDKISARIFAEKSSFALQYAITEGYIPLRELMKERLKSKYGIGREFDELIIVSGAQQGIDLTARVLAESGDTVLCESPSFIGSLNAFRAHGLNLIGLPMDEHGLQPEALENALKTQKNVRFLYTIPTFQNPTGITMTLERRKQILELCERHNVIILEDNPYGDLAYDGDPPPTLKSLDEKGIIVYVGSFSKIISPGIRMGYVSAPAPITEKMVVAKQGADVHSNLFFQMVVCEYMDGIDAHIEKCRGIYRHKRDLMYNSCIELFKNADVIKPEGGLFLWCSLKNADDSSDFCRRAVDNNVAIIPGKAFLTDVNGKTAGFRLNFSMPSDEQIAQGVEILGGLM
jgi:2-aminoadipate transaminase